MPNEPEFVAQPFYLVADVSDSMKHRGIPGLNKAVPAIADVLRENPIISDVIQIGIIDFSDDARIVLPLGNMIEDGTAPKITFASRGGTNYGEAIRVLHATIKADIERLSAANTGVYRPVVFFLSDGVPTDGAAWVSEMESLRGERFYPLFVPMGIGDATLVELEKMAWPKERSKVYLTPDGDGVEVAIEQMAKYMALSMVTPGPSGAPQIALPGRAELAASNVVVYEYDGSEFVN
jgi:uncharacterized protein YegL